MALSKRIQRKLHEAGFVNITGLKPHREVADDTKVVHSNVVENYCILGGGIQEFVFFNVLFIALLHLQDDAGGQVIVPVDTIVTSDGEVWVAKIHTSTLVRTSELMRRVCHKRLELTGSFTVKVEDFLSIIAPSMGWHTDRS